MGALPADLHIDAALTTFAQEYASQNALMIAAQVAPVIPVSKQTDRYWVHGADSYKLNVVDRGPGANYGVVSWTKSSDSYSCHGYGLSTPVTFEEQKNADPQVDPGQDAARILVDQLMLAYEVRVAALLFSTTEFTQTSALSGTDRWDDDASDPIEAVSDAKSTVRGKIGREPNTGVFGYDVWTALRDHADIRAAVFGSLNPQTVPTEEQVARVLGLERILVGRAVYESAADTFSNVWGKFASICYIDPSPGSRAIVPLRTFAWNVDGGRYAMRGPIWNDQTKSWDYFCDDYVDEKKVSLYAAYLYSTVVS